MAQPFRITDGDDPGRDRGGWDENGNVDLPGVLTVDTIRGSGSSTPSLTDVIIQAALTLLAARTSTDVLTIQVDGEAAARFVLNGDGTLEWGGGAGATDISIGRYAASGLEISGALRFTNGQLLFRPDGSVTLYSNAADTLHTDNSLDVAKNITSAGTMTSTGSAASSVVQAALVTGDTVDRYRLRADGRMDLGPGGASVRDTNLYRSGVGLLATDNSFVLAAAGGGVQVKEGTNATMGRATLVGGTVVVSTTKVTANSEVFLTCQTQGGTPGFLRVSARTGGTSFTILSSSGTDTSVVGWLIVEPAA